MRGCFEPTTSDQASHYLSKHKAALFSRKIEDDTWRLIQDQVTI